MRFLIPHSIFQHTRKRWLRLLFWVHWGGWPWLAALGRSRTQAWCFPLVKHTKEAKEWEVWAWIHKTHICSAKAGSETGHWSEKLQQRKGHYFGKSRTTALTNYDNYGIYSYRLQRDTTKNLFTSNSHLSQTRKFPVLQHLQHPQVDCHSYLAA